MLNRSKLIIAAIAVAACVSGSVNARETGIINQAGPYEQTMQFYLHPAHGFPGKSETQERRHAAMPVEAKSKQAAASKTSVPGFAVKTVSTQPALPSSNAQQPRDRPAARRSRSTSKTPPESRSAWFASQG